MIRSLLLALALSLVATAGSSGCAGSAHTSTTVVTPRLILVSPGVWVVSDYHREIFFYNDFYWWYSGGIWYRSLHYYDGFVRVSVTPAPLVRLHHRNRYIHYKAPRDAKARAVVRPRPSKTTKKPPPRKTKGRKR